MKLPRLLFNKRFQWIVLILVLLLVTELIRQRFFQEGIQVLVGDINKCLADQPNSNTDTNTKYSTPPLTEAANIDKQMGQQAQQIMNSSSLPFFK